MVLEIFLKIKLIIFDCIYLRLELRYFLPYDIFYGKRQKNFILPTCSSYIYHKSTTGSEEKNTRAGSLS